MDRRILVVDDSELIGQQLTQLLASPDRQISVAREGTTALEWLVERPLFARHHRLATARNRRARPHPRDSQPRPAGHGDRDDGLCHGRVGRRGDEAGRP